MNNHDERKKMAEAVEVKRHLCWRFDKNTFLV